MHSKHFKTFGGNRFWCDDQSVPPPSSQIYMKLLLKFFSCIINHHCSLLSVQSKQYVYNENSMFVNVYFTCARNISEKLRKYSSSISF
jgi:hypothetical protein